MCLGENLRFSHVQTTSEAVAVGEHQARSAQQNNLCRVFRREGVAHRGNDGGGNAVVVERDFVLIFAFVAIDQTCRDFCKKLRVAQKVLSLIHI